MLHLAFVFTFVCQLYLTVVGAVSSADTTSYVSIRTKDVLDNRISNAFDIIKSATVKQPVVIFEFDKFKLLDEMVEDEKLSDYSYLNKFYQDELTNVFNEDSELDRPGNDQMAFFKVNKIKQSASNILYDYPIEDYGIVWFEFTKKDYKLSELNEFIETAVIFLEEYLNINIDIIINSKGTATIEQLDNTLNNTNKDEKSNTDKSKDNKKDDKKKNKEGTVDNDILSEYWTEGLLMCLIVAALLLFILVIAISWLSSLEISYTALDKKVNPIKKTQ